MNHKSEVEARLHRSLTNQVSVPGLDGRFDAAVWARIDAETSRAASPQRRPDEASRWMRGINMAGIAITVLLVLFFGARALSGVELGFTLSMPTISDVTIEQVVKAVMWPITGLALLTGLSFTSLGRRLRAEFN
jgi:hypothetical protein